uniref:DUF1768 domain-containing protein n=1 Tax=Strongyloides venezuelensis TaxID=75913 RepID=A0A0K0FRC4_STRVS
MIVKQLLNNDPTLRICRVLDDDFKILESSWFDKSTRKVVGSNKEKQIDVIFGKYDENKLVTFPEIYKILKNRFGDAALKKSEYKDHKCDDDKDFIKLFEYDDTMAGKFSPLSNFYENPFFDDHEIQYKSMEHFFHYQKAILFNDVITGNKILKASSGLDVKKLSRKIQNYDDQKWISVRDDVMFHGLKLKFKDPLMKDYLKNCFINGQSRRRFLENSAHPYWGCKVNKNSFYIDEKNLRGQNVLGILLGKLSAELFDK